MIPYFIGPLRFEAPPDDDAAMVLTAPFGFVDSKGERIDSEAGMRTDGTSVRKLLEIPVVGWVTRKVLGGDQFTGPFRWPAIPHDQEYSEATETTFWAAFRSPARKAADRRFYEGARARWVVIEVDGQQRAHERRPADWWRAASAHAILRAAGWKAWMDNARSRKLTAKAP